MILKKTRKEMKKRGFDGNWTWRRHEGEVEVAGEKTLNVTMAGLSCVDQGGITITGTPSSTLSDPNLALKGSKSPCQLSHSRDPFHISEPAHSKPKRIQKPTPGLLFHGQLNYHTNIEHVGVLRSSQ